MAKWNFIVWALGATLIPTAIARRGLPPEMVALVLRMTLPVAPNVSDLLVALQASGHWHHLMTRVMAS